MTKGHHELSWFLCYYLSSAKSSWNYWIRKLPKCQENTKGVLIHSVKMFEKHLKLIQLGLGYVLNRRYCHAVKTHRSSET